jgi:adenylate cyclase
MSTGGALLLEQALKLDADYAVSHAHLAWCREWCFTRGGFDEADKSAALVHARIAIDGDIDDAASLAVAGWVIIVLTKEHEMALGAIERALSLNASCATAHYFAGLVNAFAGQPEAAPSTPTAPQAEPVRSVGFRGSSGDRHGGDR